MNQNNKHNVIPYYCTLPLLQPEFKTNPGNVSIPQNESVKQTRAWSQELKL